MKNITCIVLLVLGLTACGSKTKEKTADSTITGTWEFETIELYNGEKFVPSDSMEQALHKQHIGLMLTFSDGRTFTVKQKKNGMGEPDFVARQDYEMPGDTMLRLINTGRPHDEFEVISITDSLFKVNLFDSEWGYLVFRKVEAEKTK